jgi:hypothetical protein
VAKNTLNAGDHHPQTFWKTLPIKIHAFATFVFHPLEITVRDWVLHGKMSVPFWM